MSYSLSYQKQSISSNSTEETTNSIQTITSAAVKQSNCPLSSIPDSKSRKAKSLAYLAAEFVKLVKTQDNETIDVLYAAGMLGVEKRRIYDITNALIGANVLQKQGKSSYKWMFVRINHIILSGGSVTTSVDESNSTLAAQKEVYERQCAELDTILQNFTKYIEETYYNNPDVVLTTEDLVNSCQKSDDASQTIIAMSAPPGTDVFVTQNEKGRDNEIFLSSPGGEIRTYLLPSSNEDAPIYPPSMPNNPLSPPLTPKMNATILQDSSTPMDYGMGGIDSLQIPAFSNDYGLQDLFF